MASSQAKDNDDIDFNYLYESKKKSTDLWKTELNSYYQAPRADKGVDILEWWNNHKKVYPNLAKMAKDILSTFA